MKHVQIQFNRQTPHYKVGQQINALDYGDLIGIHNHQSLQKVIGTLANDGTIRVMYPKYFIYITENNEHVVYRRNEGSLVTYSCPYSPVSVTMNSFLNSECIALFSEKEYQSYLADVKGKVTSSDDLILEGTKLKNGDKVFYIRLEDGACGEVLMHDGLKDRYKADEYFLFLSAGERNNAAYRMMTGSFVPDDRNFDSATFTGQEIKDAMRKIRSYQDTDEYWTVAIQVIDFLKSKKEHLNES